MIAQTDRTRIRDVHLEDADFIFQLVNSPGWVKYIGERGINDVAAAQAYIREGFIQKRRENGFGYYLVSDKHGEKLGVAGWLKKDYLNNPDFGFAFLPQFHGQGFAYEAAQVILQLGISQFKFSQLDAVTIQDNKASIALLEKLGFNYVDVIYEPDSKEALCLYQLDSSAQV